MRLPPTEIHLSLSPPSDPDRKERIITQGHDGAGTKGGLDCLVSLPLRRWSFAFCRHQQRHRVGHDVDLGRQGSQQFAIGFDEDA
jgi:hypothetical protein